MNLQSLAIATALVLGLSGCTGPSTQSRSTPTAQATQSRSTPTAQATQSRSTSIAQAPASVSESPSNTVPRTEPAETGSKTPLPVGTVLRVRLYHAIDTRQASHGDSFIASLSAPVMVKDKTVLPKGTVVRGSIQQASKSGRLKGRAIITLTLDRMEWNGAEVPIDTNSVTWRSGDRRKRNLAWIGGGSAAGAVIGGLLGGGKGAAIGAGAGGGAGVAGAAATGLEQIRIPAESILTFRLEQPILI